MQWEFPTDTSSNNVTHGFAVGNFRNQMRESDSNCSVIPRANSYFPSYQWKLLKFFQIGNWTIDNDLG